MATTHLKFPYKWQDRKIVLHEGVLFVPQLLETYEFPTFSTEGLFGNQNPLNVEYCSGNGSWIISKALENPLVNWIAIEKKFERVSKIWTKMQKYQMKNLLIIYGEGLKVTSNFFPEATFSEIFVNFPDPWPKKRHWKHRIIQQSFLDEMQRILKPKGKLTFVTDDQDYSSVMVQELQLSKKFSPIHPNPFFVTELPGYGSSFFEALWRTKGKEIHYHLWELKK